MKKRKLKNKLTTKVEIVLNSIAQYVLVNGKLNLPKIENVIFNNHIIREFDEHCQLYKHSYKNEVLELFVHSLLPAPHAKLVLWLTKERASDAIVFIHEALMTPVNDNFINIVKELLWISYYLQQKPIDNFKLSGAPIEIINRLQFITVTKYEDAESVEFNKSDYITNVLSLKDARFNFLPIIEYISPIDLEVLLVENGLATEERLWVIRSYYTHRFTEYERYHYLDFIRAVYLQWSIEDMED